jgi:hypothetical protein
MNSWRSFVLSKGTLGCKTGSYQSNFGKFLALVVLAGNVCWLLTIGYSLYNFDGAVTLAFIILKIVFDAV